MDYTRIQSTASIANHVVAAHESAREYIYICTHICNV